MGLLQEKIEKERLDDEDYRRQQRVIAGQVLSSLRRSRGVSVSELVRRTAVSRGYIWHLEKGLIRSPDPRKISRIAYFFDAETDFLCEIFGVLPPDISSWIDRNTGRAIKLLRQVVG